MATMEVDSTESVDVELENMETNETQDTAGQSETVGNQDSRKRKVDVWAWFTRYETEDGKKRARCKCKKTYAADPRRDGTTNLRRHMNICPECKSDDIRKMVITQDANVHSRKIDQETCREMIVRAIVIHNLPFSFVEYEAIRQLLTYLNPDIKHMSRNTAKAVMLKMYKREKESLKEVLSKVSGKVCLTSDLWTSITGDGYGTITVHFVDNDWNLRSHIIAFSHFPPPHTGFALCENIMNCLKEWGIEKKVFSLTLDNASSNDVMQQSMKRQMRVDNLLICNGKHFHVRCCAQITTLFSGREYVTSNLYFLHVWRIQVKLIEEENNDDIVISRMAKGMKEKFDKYWEDYTSVLAFALVLDPRYKMDFVSFCYNKLDSSPSKDNAKAKLTRIQEELYELFEEYVKLVPIQPLQSKGTPQPSDSLASTTQMEVPDDEFDKLFNDESEFSSELDIYLEDTRFNRKKYPDLDVLNFWKTNKDRYPVLSIMARDIMSIPITTVASESAFSMGSRLLTKYRSSILPRNVEPLICLQNWLCGYGVDDLEMEDEDQELVDDVSN